MRTLIFALVAAAFSLISRPPALAAAATSVAGAADSVQAIFSLTFTGEAAPNWEYFAEELATDGQWVEVPGTTTAEVKPLRFQRPVTVGTTYQLRMRGRSTLDTTLVSPPSAPFSVLIPKPNTTPGILELKVLIVVTVVAP